MSEVIKIVCPCCGDVLILRCVESETAAGKDFHEIVERVE